MKKKALLALYSLLFLCTSMYVGTGGSMVLFSFPIAPQLTVANYYWVFVPEVDAATRFFTVMTTVMIVAALIMLAAEWRTRFRWVPIVILASITVATALTITVIFPLNHAMSAGITDPVELHTVLASWMRLNRWRVFLWLMQWLAMMWYFAAQWTPADHPAPRASSAHSSS